MDKPKTKGSKRLLKSRSCWASPSQAWSAIPHSCPVQGLLCHKQPHCTAQATKPKFVEDLHSKFLIGGLSAAVNMHSVKLLFFRPCITHCTHDIIFWHWGENLCSTTEAHALFSPCSCSSARKYLSHRSAQQALLYSVNTTARIIIRQSDVSLADCKRYSRNCHTSSQRFPSRSTPNPNKLKPHNNFPLPAHNLSKISCFPDAHTARTLLLQG